MTRAFLGPDVVDAGSAYLHPSVLLYGKLRIGAGASFWPHSVVRSEMGETSVGEYTNIQDFVMIHGGGVAIGAYCSITHHVTIHVATIEDNCLIGINATIMDGAVIGANSIVAGGAFVTEGTIVPPNSIVMGAPGKVRTSRNNFVANRMNAWLYHRNAVAYARGDYRAWDGPEMQAYMAVKRREVEGEFARLYPGS